MPEDPKDQQSITAEFTFNPTEGLNSLLRRPDTLEFQVGRRRFSARLTAMTPRTDVDGSALLDLELEDVREIRNCRKRTRDAETAN